MKPDGGVRGLLRIVSQLLRHSRVLATAKHPIGAVLRRSFLSGYSCAIHVRGLGRLWGRPSGLVNGQEFHWTVSERTRTVALGKDCWVDIRSYAWTAGGVFIYL